MNVETLEDYNNKSDRFTKKNIVLLCLSIVELLFSSFFVYKINASELLSSDILEQIVSLVIIFLTIWFGIKILLIILKKKIVPIIMIIITFLLCGGMIFYLVVENDIDQMMIEMTGHAAKNMSSLIVTKDENITTIEDLRGKTIALINNDESYEGYIIVHEELLNNSVEYEEVRAESYVELISGLECDLYDAIVLPTNYKDIFTIDGESKFEYAGFIDSVLLHKEVEEEKEEIDFGQPFTILLLGTDTPLEINSYNYDSVTLLTVNLEKKHILVTSIFRGTGMYSPCIGGADLLTHNGWGGNANCAAQTIERFFDIDIDSAVTMDFKGFVELVDAIGGIEVDVPVKFCEQNSDRKWGSNTICLEEGTQHVNGEEALAFARHRKTIGGIQRSKNQSQILSQIGDKLFNSDLLFKYDDLLNIISSNIKTNMSSDDLYEFYNMMLTFAKEVDYDFENITLTTQTTNGYDRLLYSKSVGSTMAINQITNDSYWSIYDNLHYVLSEEVKNPLSYSFSLNNDPFYDSGKLLSTDMKTKLKLIYNDPRVMPNLVGKLEEAAHKYDSQFAVFKLYVKTAYSNSVPKGYIISQSIPAGEGLNHRYKLTVTVSKGPDYDNLVQVELPNMIGQSKDYIESWATSNGLTNYSFSYVENPDGVSEDNICINIDENNKDATYIYTFTEITFYISDIVEEVSNPIITLAGETSYTVEIGETWSDPGYSATDEVAGDVTAEVVVVGLPVDTSAAGTKTITYNVTIDGRVAEEKVRTITIIEPSEQ